MPRSTSKSWKRAAEERRAQEHARAREVAAQRAVVRAELDTRCAELGLTLAPWGHQSSPGQERALALHLSDGATETEIPLDLTKPSVLRQMVADLSSDLMLLPDHAGIVQMSRGYIEAIIEDVNARSGRGTHLHYNYRIDPRLCATQEPSHERVLRRAPREIVFAPTTEGMAVEISPPSALFATLDARLTPPEYLGHYIEDLVTLKVCGVKLHDQAHGHAVLHSVARSCSIDLEARFDRGFVLAPRFDWEALWRHKSEGSTPQSRPEAVQQPLPLRLNAYADTAVSFYWDARKLESVPIHAYNAYYKVLEYHFQRYAADSAMRLLRRQMKDPCLDLSDDHDAAALVAALQDQMRKRNSKEELLTMTLASCLVPQDLAKFLASDAALTRHLSRRDILPGIPAIPKATRRDELVKRVAERLSKLRNQTVHAEGEIEDGQNLVLVPGSPAALSVSEDVKLIRHCALKVIITSSGSLDLERL